MVGCVLIYFRYLFFNCCFFIIVFLFVFCWLIYWNRVLFGIFWKWMFLNFCWFVNCWKLCVLLLDLNWWYFCGDYFKYFIKFKVKWFSLIWWLLWILVLDCIFGRYLVNSVWLYFLVMFLEINLNIWFWLR